MSWKMISMMILLKMALMTMTIWLILSILIMNWMIHQMNSWMKKKVKDIEMYEVCELFHFIFYSRVLSFFNI